LSLYQNKILTEYSNEKYFTIAYRHYLNHLSQFETTAEAYREAKINRENYNDIYDEMIGSGLFEAFFSTDTVYLSQTSEYGIRYHVRRDGKYAQLLNALAENDTVYASHVKSLQIVGDFQPWIIATLIHNNEDYDLTDQKVQLFYMLTLLKPYK